MPKTKSGSGKTPPLSAAEAVALSKFSAGTARKELAVGTYPVQFAVRVRGQFVVEPDREQLTVGSAELHAIVAVLLRRNSKLDLDQVVAEALAGDTPYEDLEELRGRVRQQVSLHKEPSPVTGSVVAHLEVTRLAR